MLGMQCSRSLLGSAAGHPGWAPRSLQPQTLRRASVLKCRLGPLRAENRDQSEQRGPDAVAPPMEAETETRREPREVEAPFEDSEQVPTSYQMEEPGRASQESFTPSGLQRESPAPPAPQESASKPYNSVSPPTPFVEAKEGPRAVTGEAPPQPQAKGQATQQAQQKERVPTPVEQIPAPSDKSRLDRLASVDMEVPASAAKKGQDPQVLAPDAKTATKNTGTPLDFIPPVALLGVGLGLLGVTAYAGYDFLDKVTQPVRTAGDAASSLGSLTSEGTRNLLFSIWSKPKSGWEIGAGVIALLVALRGADAARKRIAGFVQEAERRIIIGLRVALAAGIVVGIAYLIIAPGTR